MRPARALGCLVLVGVLIFLLPGCLKLKWKVTVYPDSSGKVVVVMGLSKTFAALGALADEPDGDSLESLLTANEIIANSTGIVWGEQEEYTKGGYDYSKVTGYFEDINEVELGALTYSMKTLEDGSMELSFDDSSIGEEFVGEDNPFSDMEQEMKLVRGMAKMALSAFEISFDFNLPGEVTEAEGLKFEGRDARFTVGIDELLEMLEEPELAEEGFKGTIRTEPPGDLDEEIAAFRKEMAKAIAEAEEVEPEEEEAPPGDDPEEEKVGGKQRREY